MVQKQIKKPSNTQYGRPYIFDCLKSKIFPISTKLKSYIPVDNIL